MTTTATTSATYTAYAAAKLVNLELAKLGLPNIPAQMIYNYVGKGYIKSTVNGEGKKVVSEADLATWFVGYVEKKASKAQKLVTAIAAATPAEEPEVEDNTIPLFDVDAK